MSDEPSWLSWGRKLRAIAQTGLTFSEEQYDRERYEQVRAIAAEMLAAHTDAEPEYLRGLFEREEGYATPKVDVRAGVFRDGGILLVRERRDGLWTLPGGWADVNDAPSEAIEREVREESGFEARAVKLAAVFDRRGHGHPPSPRHTYKLFFLCELLGGAATLSYETDGVEFFAEDALPPLSLPRVTPEEIALLFRHQREPQRPTDFD